MSERLRQLEIPFVPDSVVGPEVVYGQRPAHAVYYQTREDEWVRVTFEKLDSLRVCRGEHLPYEGDRRNSPRDSPVFTVENSTWLRERHAYEARHYRESYEFGGDVDEMLEFEHYLLAFHDEYVEALADGIWFEKHPQEGPNGKLPPSHPFQGLSRDAAEVHESTLEGRRYEIWCSRTPSEALLSDARLCSQPLWTFVLDPVGAAYTVDLRARRTGVRTTMRDCVGNAMQAWDGLASLDVVQEAAAAAFRELVARNKDEWKRDGLW